MSPKVLKVLIADDSATARTILVHVINSEPDLNVVGEAVNGKQVVKMAASLHPDVILMDIFMPDMDGLEATSEIMHMTPTPIVMVSGSGDEIETTLAFKAINSGALTAIRKLPGLHDPNYQNALKNLLNTLRAMSAVRVIHRWKPEPAPKPASRLSTPTNLPQIMASQIVAPQIVAIVSSTGGPSALSDIIHNLPADFRLPVVIVQHITADFIPSLVDWLSNVTSLKVMVARQGDLPRPGSIYLAPGDAHLRLTKGLRFELNPSPDSMLHRPSGDIFLTSVAQAYGAQAVGIVLTGMGEDGAHGLRAMYDKGAYTIAQDEATSVVYGMPCRAAELGAVQQILPLSQIASVLTELAGHI